MSMQSYRAIVQSYADLLDDLKGHGLGLHTKVQSGLLILDVLERIAVDHDSDPFSALESALSGQSPWLAASASFQAEHSVPSNAGSGLQDASKETISLFEAAWTTYSESTYEHSVELIRKRLEANGFDRSFFKDKTCFDGGCGTGRFSVAMAELGARKVVAADLGGSSLAYLENVKKARRLENIEIVQTDVTDLSAWPDGHFDFVVSNGVLHHAPETERGIREHFRVTRPGGIYWLYLYGEGGIYWPLYDVIKDRLRDVTHAQVKETLARMEVREGLIYTYLDNVKCPIRKYYLTSDVVAMLKPMGSFTHRNMIGTSFVDDTEKVLASKYGRDIWGPEGEVRIRIDKK